MKLHWTMEDVLGEIMGNKHELCVETGVKEDTVQLRLTATNGTVTIATFSPDFAREIGRQLIGQANILDVDGTWSVYRGDDEDDEVLTCNA